MVFGVVGIINPPWLQKISKPGKETEVRGIRNSADQMMREGRYDLALKAYQEIQRIDPEDVACQVNAAIALGSLGRAGEGMRMLRKAMEQNPKGRGSLLYNLAELHRKVGEPERALAVYTAALEAGGPPELIWGRVAEIHLEAGRKEEAREAYRQALIYREDPVRIYGQMLLSAHDALEDPGQVKVIEEVFARGLTSADVARYDLEYLRGQIEQDPERARILGKLGELEAQPGPAEPAARSTAIEGGAR